MDRDKIIDEAKDYVRELFAGMSDGHDAGHTLRVYALAMRIAEGEPDCDRFVTALAALLHDADDRKLFHTENNANARAFMAARGVDADTADRVCIAVNAVSFSQNKGRLPSTAEGRVVRDADRLDAMGAVGVARTFAFGGRAGRPLRTSVDHFHEKLLLLRDGLLTDTARRMGEDRHRFLEVFLRTLEEETSGQY